MQVTVLSRLNQSQRIASKTRTHKYRPLVLFMQLFKRQPMPSTHRCRYNSCHCIERGDRKTFEPLLDEVRYTAIVSLKQLPLAALDRFAM
jgi:hypothetical protein